MSEGFRRRRAARVSFVCVMAACELSFLANNAHAQQNEEAVLGEGAEQPETAEQSESAEPFQTAGQPKTGETPSVARKIANYVGQSFKRNTETRDRKEGPRFIADRMENVLEDFIDIGAYVRAGYGRDGKGSSLAAVQAPGAASKYRLGNEAENYGELILSKNVYIPGVFHMDDRLRSDGTPVGPIAHAQLRLSLFNPYSAHSSAGATSVGLPEAWVAISNVIKSQPTAKFWAGNRFYRRHDIHVIDFFYWNMSGGGGGIEDVRVGPGKLAFAWIGLAATSGLSYLPQPDAENRAGFSKSNYDLRFYDLPLLGGQTEVGLTFSHAESGLDRDGNQAPSSMGMAVNLVHTVNHFLSEDGVNKVSFQYGTGPAKSFTSGFETFTQDGGTFIRPDEQSSWRFRFTESFTASLNQHFSIGPVVIFQATDFGNGQGQQMWVSGGLRPIVHFNRYFNVALEGGMDWVRDQEADTEGALYKLTIAPQVAVGNQFNTRPVVRAFATLAKWTNDFEGQVGGLDYASSTHAMNWGMQMETWW